MNRLLLGLLIFGFYGSAQAISLDLGLGYSLIDLKNPDGSTARSTGVGGAVGGYYSIWANQNYDFGIKGSVFYSKMKNDANSAVLSEKTEFLNFGLGLELTVYDFFFSWQYKHARTNITTEGSFNNTSTYSRYMSQLEVGYEWRMDTKAVRFAYQVINSSLPTMGSGLSSDVSLSQSAFMIYLRFDFMHSPSTHRSTYDPYSETWPYGSSSRSSSSSSSSEGSSREASDVSYSPNYRTYRYSPRPSTRIK
ncbi:MAG: hypothetical protein H6623_09660 [Bdellovibrionaceae bacterium]|nr:hypothetical protein [Pseudobdellovibrionaceae bacterium]